MIKKIKQFFCLNHKWEVRHGFVDEKGKVFYTWYQCAKCEKFKPCDK